METCKESQDPGMNWPSKSTHGVNVGKLEGVLNLIDYSAIRKRKAVFSRLYQEAIISHGHGISFNEMLILLAHHKFIVDAEALV